MWKKILTYGFLIILLMLVIIGITGYEKGQNVENLKKKYTYPESAFVEIEGMNVHYRKTGQGIPLILLHGVASSLHTWNDWQKELSKDFTVYTLDEPSFGLTGPHPKDDYSLDMYMRFLDAFIEKMGIDSCYMGGNSFGGFLTWNYALHNPQVVQKAILSDAAGISTAGHFQRTLGFALAAGRFTKNITHRITPRFLVNFSVKQVYGDNSKIKDGQTQLYYDLLTRDGNREGFSEVLNMIVNDKNNEKDIKQVSQPTLIIWGDKDRIIPLEDATTFHELIPNSELIIYEGVGHIPMEEIPKKSVQDAKAFLLK